jgi:hypothetical protein
MMKNNLVIRKTCFAKLNEIKAPVVGDLQSPFAKWVPFEMEQHAKDENIFDLFHYITFCSHYCLLFFHDLFLV